MLKIPRDFSKTHVNKKTHMFVLKVKMTLVKKKSRKQTSLEILKNFYPKKFVKNGTKDTISTLCHVR